MLGAKLPNFRCTYGDILQSSNICSRCFADLLNRFGARRTIFLGHRSSMAQAIEVVCRTSAKFPAILETLTWDMKKQPL